MSQKQYASSKIYRYYEKEPKCTTRIVPWTVENTYVQQQPPPPPQKKITFIKRFEQTEPKLKSMNIYTHTLPSNYT